LTYITDYKNLPIIIVEKPLYHNYRYNLIL
jgi:hypothetical protein